MCWAIYNATTSAGLRGPYKAGGLWRGGPYKRGTTVQSNLISGRPRTGQP